MPYLTRRSKYVRQPTGEYELAPNVLAAYVGGEGIPRNAVSGGTTGSIANLREGVTTGTGFAGYARGAHAGSLTFLLMGWWAWGGASTFRLGSTGQAVIQKQSLNGRMLVYANYSGYAPAFTTAFSYSANPSFAIGVGHIDLGSGQVRCYTNNGNSHTTTPTGSYTPPINNIYDYTTTTADYLQAAVAFAGIISPQELFRNPWGWARPVRRTRTYFFPSAGGSSDTSITPSNGSATLVGYAPTLISPQLIAPDAGAMSFTGLAAALSTAFKLTPDVGTLSIQGYAPATAASQNFSISPDTGVLSLLGYAPGLIYGDLNIPQLGQIQLAGYAPTVARADGAAPQAGTLTLLGYQPGVSNQLFVLPGVGSIVLQGVAASVPTAGVAIPDVATLTILGYQPGVFQQLVTIPGVGAVSLTSYQPSVSQQSSGAPLAGAITFDGQQAIITRQDFVVPGVGAIDMQGQSALVEGGRYILPSVGVVTFLGYQPRALLDSRFEPQTGAISIQGRIPTIVYDSGSALAQPGVGQLGLLGYAAGVVTAVFIDGSNKIWYAKPMLRTWMAAPESKTWH